MMRARTGLVLVNSVKYKWYFGPSRCAITTDDSELDAIPEMSVECGSGYNPNDANMALRMIPAPLHAIKDAAWDKWLLKQGAVE